MIGYKEPDLERRKVTVKKIVGCFILIIVVFAMPAFAADNDPASEKPRVSFSEWRSEPVSDTMNAYTRDITVSYGGNYLMTYLDISGSGRYYFYYDAIWQGKGEQKVFSHNWDEE